MVENVFEAVENCHRHLTKEETHNSTIFIAQPFVSQ